LKQGKVKLKMGPRQVNIFSYHPGKWPFIFSLYN
jgi:hypothetical protein